MNWFLRDDIFEDQSGSGRSSVGTLFDQGANAWNFSPGTLILIWLIPIFVIGIAVVSALLGKEMYKLFTGEDKIAETLQVLFYAIACVLSLTIVKLLLKDDQKFVASLYIIVCIGLFFMLGEELNWGQRLIGWQTPDSWEAINKQKETNIHNIYGVGFAFKWMQLAVGAYGSILPLLILNFRVFRRYKSFLSFLIPHYTLIPFFMPLFFWRIYRNFFEAPRQYYFAIAEFNEVMELILSIGMAFFMIFQYRRLRARQAPGLLKKNVHVKLKANHD